MKQRPLEGVRIIDFTWVGAGPYTTKILADAGAEVIKIESAKRPDVLRFMPPFPNGIKGINRSGYFANRNTNKKSLQLDMSLDESKALIKELVKSADIVSNSFTAGTLERWGLGYEELKAIKPDIIFMSMPMQGTTGPHKQYSGFGAMMNALIGLNHLTGLAEREPIGTGTNYPDHVPNPTHGAFAMLAALRYRRRTGKGQYVELAQTESALNVLAVGMMEAANNLTSPIRQGNFVAESVPHNAYPCQGEDRWCVVACDNDEQWQALLTVPGLTALKNIQNTQTIEGRTEQIEAIDMVIRAWTATQTAEAVMQQLQALHIPSGIVQTAKDLVDCDEQLKAREHILTLAHPEMGNTLYNNAPFKMSASTVRPTEPAPLIGQHTAEVLGDLLQLSEEDLKKRAHLFQ